MGKINYEELTYNQIRSIAKEKGITLKTGDKKVDLITKINAIEKKAQVSDKPKRGEY